MRMYVLYEYAIFRHKTPIEPRGTSNKPNRFACAKIIRNTPATPNERRSTRPVAVGASGLVGQPSLWTGLLPKFLVLPFASLARLARFLLPPLPLLSLVTLAALSAFLAHAFSRLFFQDPSEATLPSLPPPPSAIRLQPATKHTFPTKSLATGECRRLPSPFV